MRIVHYNAGGPEFTGREFQYDAHHAHMIDELRKRGHDVLHVNPAALLGRYGTRAEYGDVTVQAVKEFADAGGCDLFFSTAVDHSFDPETAREISRLGIPTVNLGMDDLSHPFRVKEVTSAFDLVWTTDVRAMPRLKKYGARNLVHMPYGANPNIFYPVSEPDFERAIVFIGACYGARSRAIAMLAQADVPIRVYGTSPMDIYGDDAKSLPALRGLFSYRDGWHRAFQSMAFHEGRTIVRAALLRTVENTLKDLPEKHPKKGNVEYRQGPSFEDWSRVMGGRALSLGSLELASTFVLSKPITFIRFREFEAAMCGAAHLVNYNEELASYFAPDKEMIFFESFEEMIDKARFWLHPDRDGARQKMREAVRASALGAHTWSHRFQACCDHLGIHQTV
ncbi:CgeB family protein [Primorskyibacter sp. S187A]|uniref:CgeB family protein n=1 Tax=Primorskyibacter sp. S187A TaxID=3415130 RepID=UPI003C7AECE1